MVRNMGTIGGSIANADPAACYPAGVLAFNATIHTDRRTIAADDFFTGLWETALQPGELITAVAVPGGAEGGVRQVQAAGVALRADRRLRRADVRRRARRRHRREGTCLSCHRDRERARQELHAPTAAKAVKMPTAGINADLHGSAEYRAAMISVIASRAVAAALAR